MDRDILRHQIKMSKEATTKTKFDMYEKMINLGPGSIEQVRINTALDVMFDLMDRFGQRKNRTRLISLSFPLLITDIGIVMKVLGIASLSKRSVLT